MKKIFAATSIVLSMLGTTSLAQAAMTTIPTDWWSNQSSSNNVHQNGVEEVRLSAATSGSIEGTVTLTQAATWLITFDVRTDGNTDVPAEFVEININSNFVSKIFNSPILTTYPVSYSFFGDEFTYNFIFSSPVADLGSHLIVEAGEVSVVPIPGAVWLLGSGLIGIAGIRTRRTKRKSRVF